MCSAAVVLLSKVCVQCLQEFDDKISSLALWLFVVFSYVFFPPFGFETEKKKNNLLVLLHLGMHRVDARLII